MTWHAYKRVLISGCASCRCSNEVEALLFVSSIVVFVTVYALLSRLLPYHVAVRFFCKAYCWMEDENGREDNGKRPWQIRDM